MDYLIRQKPLPYLKLKLSFAIAAWLMIFVSLAFIPVIPHPDGLASKTGIALTCVLAVWAVGIGMPATVWLMALELFRKEMWHFLRTLGIFMGLNAGLALWVLTPFGEMIASR